MQHIEDAGIHSGDSACVLPPYLIDEHHLDEMREHTVALAKALKVVGLINVQYAIKDGNVYVLEVNPRGSRTVPRVQSDRRSAAASRPSDARRTSGHRFSRRDSPTPVRNRLPLTNSASSIRSSPREIRPRDK